MLGAYHLNFFFAPFVSVFCSHKQDRKFDVRLPHGPQWNESVLLPVHPSIQRGVAKNGRKWTDPRCSLSDIARSEKRFHQRRYHASAETVRCQPLQCAGSEPKQLILFSLLGIDFTMPLDKRKRKSRDAEDANSDSSAGSVPQGEADQIRCETQLHRRPQAFNTINWCHQNIGHGLQCFL